MSRVGKKNIPLPDKVTVTVDGSDVTVKGPKGELTQSFHRDISIAQEDGELVISRPTDLHGLTRALLNNMVTGVSEGFTRQLQIEGVGYRAEVQGEDLILYVGYSHEVRVNPPQGIIFDVPKESRGRDIVVQGIDKQVVGQIAANIRRIRPPEPYKGKGIRYKGEYIRMKAGKAGKTG